MNFQQIRKKTDQLRAIPLTSVLRLWGAQPDPRDPHKWHTSQGIISITGPKFINWNRGGGGGGAIDLVIHLKDCPFPEALDWLQGHFPQPLAFQEDPSMPGSSLCLPPPDPLQLHRVKDYLATQRAISPTWIDPLIEAGTLYADHRANAVFLLRSPEGSPVGAELRGTTSRPWRGMAPGSRKDLGFFSFPVDPATHPPRPLILCESAIDAISAFALHPDHRCLSTSGARPHPAWLPPLLDHRCPIYCGFDADNTGERMARFMMATYPPIQRLRPSKHDWNDQLRSRS